MLPDSQIRKWYHQSIVRHGDTSLYKLQAQIGRGNYSIVRSGYHRLTKEKVAIKICSKQTQSKLLRKMLRREIAIMERVFHPNIVRLFEVLETPTKLHLVMEYMSGGGLYDKIINETKIKEMDAKVIFAQLLSAVQYLHDKNIIHRDIKAENVFCGDRNLVKLGDFGFSTVLVQGKYEKLFTICGSLPYVAPELLQDKRYEGQPVDIYALGVLLYFMTTGQMPFAAATIAQLKRTIILGVVPTPAHLSHSCTTLIRSLLRTLPIKRPNVFEIRNCTWLSDIMISENTYDQWYLMPSANSAQMTEVELEARERLSKFGIDGKTLESHATKGVSSDVIVTYRIIVHKILTDTLMPRVTRLSNTASRIDPPKSQLCKIM